MVELANKQSSTTVNRVASAVGSGNRIRSHFDDLLKSPEELSKQRLANELATELWSRLPISRVPVELGDRGIEHTIRIVTTSTSELQTWYPELSDFVAALTKAATEHSGETLTDTMQAELSADVEQQMLGEVRFPLPNRSFVDFKFADLPPAEAWAEPHRRLEQACLEFANQVFALFDTLQQKKLVGQIQETSSTCRFTYFRRVAIAGLPQTSTRKRVQHDSPQEPAVQCSRSCQRTSFHGLETVTIRRLWHT
jgi:hypothetical protein